MNTQSRFGEPKRDLPTCRRQNSIDNAPRWRQHARTRSPYRYLSGMARDSARTCYMMMTSESPCPQCGQCSMEVLEFADGRATYCPQCGYRGLIQAAS